MADASWTPAGKHNKPRSIIIRRMRVVPYPALQKSHYSSAHDGSRDRAAVLDSCSLTTTIARIAHFGNLCLSGYHNVFPYDPGFRSTLPHAEQTHYIQEGDPVKKLNLLLHRPHALRKSINQENKKWLIRFWIRSCSARSARAHGRSVPCMRSTRARHVPLYLSTT
jgi:hypothetical protein